jgi:hypothetical protein
MNIIIAGLAKNCEDNLKKNIKYLIDFKEIYRENVKLSILVLENDSKDNTKKIIEIFENENLISSYCLDGLDQKITNRIERITYCRNYLLEMVRNFHLDAGDYIYISADFDVDLFSKTVKDKFFKILTQFNNQNQYTAIFPNNVPYYYDIHALRKNGWNTLDSWKKYNQISKYVPIGKFFLKYFYIFKKQIKISSDEEFMKVDSAFGGMGIYNISDLNFSNIIYRSDDKFEKCEHIDFNSNFICGIQTSWNIESPNEHLEFRNLNFLSKVKYIFNSLFRDLKSFFLYFKKN